MEREKRIEGLDGESVTDVFRGKIEWRERIGKHSGTSEREREREAQLSGGDRGATRAVLPPIGNVASAPHPGQCRARSDGECFTVV